MSDRQQVPTAQPRWSWGHHANQADRASQTGAATLAAQPRWSWG